MTVLICGIPSEPPIALVLNALEQLDVPYVMFNQRNFADISLHFELSAEKREPHGWLQVDGRGYRLENISGVYVRLMDFRLLPELKDSQQDSEAYIYCSNLHDALFRWCEIAPCRVVNRAASMSSNNSKPFQAQIIRTYGFEVPETLVTNNPDRVLAFREKHKRIIYKSISGIRSIVSTLEDDDLERLPDIRWLPTQFQEYVEGFEVRVHVVGSEVFPTAIKSTATDYRYADTLVGRPAELTPFKLPADVAKKCVRLTEGMGLAFSGIDLKVAPDGRFYCFEVNPSPGYSYYEANTEQPISLAVARYVAGRQPA